jgi:hypothetical protein
MSEPQSQPRGSGPRAGLLGCLGTVLLLPGLCSLLFVPLSWSLEPEQHTHEALWRDPLVVTLWPLGLVIGAVGFALTIFTIWRARQSRRS